MSTRKILASAVTGIFMASAMILPSSAAVVFEKNFNDGELSPFAQCGGPTLEVTGGELRVTNRTNNWDTIDLPFAETGIELGNDYVITVKGRVIGEAPAEAAMEILAPGKNASDGSDSYTALASSAEATEGTSGAYPVGNDEVFEMNLYFNSSYLNSDNYSEITAIRIQTNDAGKTMSFAINTVEIETLGTEDLEEDNTTGEDDNTENNTDNNTNNTDNNTGNTNNNTENTNNTAKGSANTGVAGVSIVTGIALIAGYSAFISRKRK